MTELDLQPILDEIRHPESGPRQTKTLQSRRSPLATPSQQIAALEKVSLGHTCLGGDFSAAIAKCGSGALVSGAIEIFQINLCKLCNMTCRHCHVDAGPDRWREVMSRETVDACLAALDRTGAHTCLLYTSDAADDEYNV